MEKGMGSMAGIKYIPHHKIDPIQWDNMVNSSLQPLIYAQSWYLNAATNSQWDALVLGDYDAGMPLPIKKRMGISVIYQPFFCQQLGVFSKKETITNYNDFIQAMPNNFAAISLQLNGSLANATNAKSRTNLVIDVNKSLQEIHNKFHADVHKNLRKAERIGVKITNNTNIDEVIRIYRDAWGSSNPDLQEDDYKRFKNIYQEAQKHNCAELYVAHSENKILGAAAVFLSPKLAHYVLAAPTTEGRKVGIMHSIIAAIIEKHNLTGRNVDLEGSEIPSVKDFYLKFGSENKPYFSYTYNKWWWKIIDVVKRLQFYCY